MLSNLIAAGSVLIEIASSASVLIMVPVALINFTPVVLAQTSAPTVTVPTQFHSVATPLAQSLPPQPQNLSRPQPLRVQVNMQMNSPVPPGADDQSKLVEDARRKIYESSANECSVLSDVFKLDCRIASLNVNSSIQDRGVAGQSIIMSGNTVYELVPHDQ